MHLRIDALRTLAFLTLVFGSQATIYAIRERRHLWGTRPSLALALSSVADIGIAATLAVSGIAMTPLPPLMVAATLAAAVVFAFVLDMAKIPVFTRLGITQGNRSKTHETGDIANKNGNPMTEPNTDQQRTANIKSEPDATPKTAAEPKSQAHDEPGPDVKVQPVSSADVAALLNTPFGDVLVAGLIGDPEDAGRLIAQGVVQTNARIAAAKKVPEVTPEPAAGSETAPAAAPKAAE
jgi:hypothetical protein